ncbi:MAG: tRNA pseudouridine(55) synthase TruB, partial [Anaerolineae bacterium]|nr:tRNA pseudouridine(55) synthase TruB [Anaerolineae bacterium]
MSGAQRAHGIFNINKPYGLTSHDVVAEVRRLLDVRRVGHAGTLDPIATGVLLVCVGQATRVAEYLMQGQKLYRATFHLGVETDTYDATGTVVRETPLSALSREEIVYALEQLRQMKQQLPPLFSAVRQGGERLYRLARRGIAVELKPRPIEIVALEIVSWQPPLLTLEVHCSPGTYVRSLAHDLGALLGVGAHVCALQRLASGAWRIEEAITLEQLRTAVVQGDWMKYLHPLDAALHDLPRLEVTEEVAARLAQGQWVPLP